MQTQEIAVLSIAVVLCGWFFTTRTPIRLQNAAARRKFRNITAAIKVGIASHPAGEFSSGIVQHEWKSADKIDAALAECGHCIDQKRLSKIELILKEYKSASLNFGHQEDVKVSESKKTKLIQLLDEILVLAR